VSVPGFDLLPFAIVTRDRRLGDDGASFGLPLATTLESDQFGGSAGSASGPGSAFFYAGTRAPIRRSPAAKPWRCSTDPVRSTARDEPYISTRIRCSGRRIRWLGTAAGP